MLSPGPSGQIVTAPGLQAGKPQPSPVTLLFAVTVSIGLVPGPASEAVADVGQALGWELCLLPVYFLPLDPSIKWPFWLFPPLQPLLDCAEHQQG